MYIVKNALRCIGRSLGRNILIGIIALVIAVSACIGLSIRGAADNARESALAGMTITATISFDRQSMMNGMMGGGGSHAGGGGGFDRNQLANMMNGASALTLEDYKTYATAESVKDFYYTLTAYLDGAGTLSPISMEGDGSESTDDGTLGGWRENSSGSQFPSGMMGGGRMSTGDFTLIGYSSDSAMTDFISGSASVTDGAVFEEGTASPDCIISAELATYNTLSVGDTLTLTNPNDETETYTLTVVGIYTSDATNDFAASMLGFGHDPANEIYVSAPALQAILDASEGVSETLTDEDTGRSYETAITGALSATYVFPDTDAYGRFEEEARALGLDDAYTVSSADVSAFEASLTPLNTLGTMAGWFLVVILLIGAVILVVLNIFNVRERKYEVGVLTAMGMKKWKVAVQFTCEILIVTMLAVIIGVGIGGVSSVPVTNALLENQVETQASQQTQRDESFGRPGGGRGGMSGSESMPELPQIGVGGNRGTGFGGAVEYITQIDSAMDLTVVLQMIGVGLLLTLVTSLSSVLFVMRYDPLKILSNRD